MPMSANSSIVQNAYVVKDLYQAIDKWSKLLNIGPFFINENLTFDVVYRGQPTVLQVSVATVQSGGINIELIQPLVDTPSVYADIYAHGAEGFHHICMVVDNYDEQVQRFCAQGHAIAMQATMGDCRFCYIDTYNTLGCMTELVENKSDIRALYQHIREAAETWDGHTDLIRPMQA